MNRSNVLILALFVFSAAFGQTVNKGWTKLERKEYSIEYPSDWSIKADYMGTLLFLFSPKDSDKDQFRENVNLMSESVAGLNLTLDEYGEISEEDIAFQMPNYSPVKSEEVKSTSGNYYHLAYSGTQKGLSLMFEQYLFIKNETAYVLTFTCEKSKYQNYKATGQKILNSFRLK